MMQRSAASDRESKESMIEAESAWGGDVQFASLNAPSSKDALGYAAWAHAIWFSGSRSLHDAAIAELRHRTPDQVSAYTMLRSDTLFRLGDLEGGFALLKRAALSASDGARDYYVDVLAPLSVTYRGIDAAESELVGLTGFVPELGPNFLAVKSILAAIRGQHSESRRCSEQALDICPSLPPYQRALILFRVAAAAYHRLEHDYAEELASTSIRISTNFRALRLSCHAWSLLSAIAHVKNEDMQRVTFYSQKMMDTARAMHDDYSEARALYNLLDIGIGSGDEHLLAVTQPLLRDRATLAGPDLRSNFCIAEVLRLGWSGRFQAARITLERHLRSLDDEVIWPIHRGERALTLALLGATFLGLNEIDQCRRFVRRAIFGSRSAAHGHEDPLCADLRRKARILAAATCMVIGDRFRARRSLSAEFREHADFVDAFSDRPIDVDCVSPRLRGYARFLLNAQGAYEKQNPVKLTAAEAKVLTALLEGMTQSQIARHLNKAESTVKMQLRSVYHRLGVRNRIGAMRRARELDPEPRSAK